MSYDFMLQQAISLHEQGNLDGAEKLYRQLLKAMPEQPDILNLLGLIAQAKGIDNEAVNLFYEAIKKAPDRAPFYFNLALSLKAWGKYYEAIDNFEKALVLQPDIKEAYVQIGQIYQNLNKIEKSREYFNKAINLDGDYIEAKARLASTFDDDTALPLLLKNSNDALSLYFAALIYMRKNDIENAKKLSVSANALAPHADEIKVLLAQLFVLDNDYAEAENWFKKALLLNEYNEAAIVGLANLYVQLNNYVEAEILYKKLLEINPNNLDAHINYAALMHKQKRLSEALEEYRKAVIINPNVPEISYNLALVLKDVGEFEEALGLLFNALTKLPEMKEISLTIGEVITSIYRNDDKVKAKEIAQNWSNSYPDNLFAKHILAAVRGEKVENNKVYTESLFELFADDYELVMSNLDYTVPLVMGRVLGNVKNTIVDLGCGSGLVGQIIKSSENYLIGVDISKNMLNKAKDKNVYDELIHMDIEEYLQSGPDAEVFVAADVFNYIGDLKKIFSLIDGRKIIFSIEENNNVAEFALSESGRFVHNPKYIRRLLKSYNFENVNEYPVVLRYENANAVNGIIFETK